MISNLRTLGRNEARVVLTFREEKRSIVRAAEIIALLGNERKGRKVTQSLVRKGWLTRLVGGRYLFIPPEYGPENLGENNVLALASAVVEPCYVGWWAAASYHSFTTQRPVTTCVATRRQYPSRTIEGNLIRFVPLIERKFFGFQEYEVFGRKAMISSPAKTVVDCVDRVDLAGGPAEAARIVHGAESTVRAKEILEAALQMKSAAMLQRLGFLLDLVGWVWADPLRRRLRYAIPRTTRNVFGRTERREGDVGYVPQWGLIVHARAADLLADVPRAKEANRA